MMISSSGTDSPNKNAPAQGEVNPPDSLKPPRLDRVTRQELHDYFVNSWKLYDWLFSSLNDDRALYYRPDPLRHPLVFYWGHSAAFYINKLVMAGLLKQGLNPHYEELFARGVDPASAQELETTIDWPEKAEVNAYRNQVYETVLDLIATVGLENPIGEGHPLWSLLMGIEHDRIHFETSSVLLRQYPAGMVRRPEGWRYAPCNRIEPRLDMISIPPGSLTLGKSRKYPTFGWDNEYGRLAVEVPAFEAGRNLVTNGSFLEFVHGGGYANRRLWSEAGWTWRSRHGVKHPAFWLERDGAYHYRALFDELKMPLDWPVEVNCHEAEAFCRWKGAGYRLLSEGEFRRLTEGVVDKDDDVAFHDGFNLNLGFGSPCPAGWLKSATSPLGVQDVYGNLWVWLSDDFYPLPGFRAHDLYENFSQPYFDDQHAMMLGGSWATLGTGASKYYRLWFRRHFIQHAGFRLARDTK